MFIFRFEHDRSECTLSYYMPNGESLTGHGIGTTCDGYEIRPNFGWAGYPPCRIMVHERCAVTANQFDYWIESNFFPMPCTYSDEDCSGSFECQECGEYRKELSIPEGWNLVAYWVEDSAFGIDWREDNDQICFNPEFAVNMGPVTIADAKAFQDENSLI
jgi:hypothetical protein